jgi:hypothetical protein
MKAHFMFIKFFSEYCAIYELMLKNMVDAARHVTDEDIEQCMCFACQIPKVTDTLIIFNTYCLSVVTVAMQTCLSVLFFIYIAFLLLLAEAILDVLVQSAASIFWISVR